MPITKEPSKEEWDWRERTAAAVARRFCPSSLFTFYDLDDAAVTAKLALHRAWLLGKPRNYQVTCAGRAVIDDVRSWVGRTGKKTHTASPASLDAIAYIDWLPCLEESSSKEERETIESDDSFESIISALPGDQREVISLFFKQELTAREIASELKLPIASVLSIKESALAQLRCAGTVLL